jgi:LmbE family N-acetylglucosaminyl deacetylase
MRVHKEWTARRASILRSLAVTFGNLAETCTRFATSEKPTPKKQKAGTRAQIGWRSLLTQLGTHTALARALDWGMLGNDMSRESRLPIGKRILVLAAHQDDETIAAAGTFILCARAGYKFSVVYYTDGDTTFPGLDSQQTSRLRYEEARKVWRKIAGIKPVFWGYPNRAPEIVDGAPERLAALIAKFKPRAIFVPVFLEQPLEHRRISEVLARAHAISPLPATIEVWGYQITTRAPGNVVVDITEVARKKYAVNRLWVTQNYYMDYAHLAHGRDIASSYFLKSQKRGRTAAQAETFLVFDAPTYCAYTSEFLDLPSRPAILARAEARSSPPPNFFIIGMQKSGTYWLTALLDLHPQIRCFPSRPGHQDGSGEAHLFDQLALLESDYRSFSKSMRRRLDGAFAAIIPKHPPESAEERVALIDEIRLRFNEYCQLQRLRYGKPVVGEKTTESVHHLDLLEKMYPQASKICVLRDPRDRAVSFFFHQMRKGRLAGEEKLSAEHVEAYVERVRKDYTGLLRASPPIHVLTYESMLADPHAVTAGILHALGFEPDPATVEAMVDGATFERLARRAAGDEDAGSHFRKGIVGDWRQQLDPAQARHMVDALEDLTTKVEARFGLNLGSYRSQA